MREECDYPGCDQSGPRHLMGGYFCGEHRSEIVADATHDERDLYEYVQELRAQR